MVSRNKKTISCALFCLVPMMAPLRCVARFPDKNWMPGDAEIFLFANLARYPGTPTALSTINDSWSCSASINCQNVYDYYLNNPAAGDSLSMNVTNVTGSSVVRMSVFGPGVALSGTNLINGSLNDHVCPHPPTGANQNASASASVTSLAGAGICRVAIGRDWGSSGGSSGTYTLTVSLSSGSIFNYVGPTSVNSATLSSGMQCP
jgi:hypothetical protein